MHLFGKNFFTFLDKKYMDTLPVIVSGIVCQRSKRSRARVVASNTSHIQPGSLRNLTYYTNATKIVTANVKNFTTQREKNAVRDI